MALRTSLAGRVALAAVVVAVFAAACGESEAAPAEQTWTFADVALRYPGDFAPGELALGSVVTAGDCICHVAAPPSPVTWRDVASQSLRYRGSGETGLSVRIVDTSLDADFAAVAADVTEAAMSAITSQLDVPLTAAEAGLPLAGADGSALPVARSDELTVTTADGKQLLQQDWAAIDAAAGRVYVFACQYTASQRTAVLRVCRDVIASFAIR